MKQKLKEQTACIVLIIAGFSGCAIDGLFIDKENGTIQIEKLEAGEVKNVNKESKDD